MIKKLLKVLILVAGTSQAHLINTPCSHEMFTDPALSVCRILPENQSVHYENTEIILNNTTKTVKGFIAEDMQMYYVPMGIEKFFKKLLLLVIKNTGLRKVGKRNLESFSSLIYLDLSYNQIEILDYDLFSANKFLSAIILDSNKIKVVEENVFNSLDNLNRIDFRNNECYSGMADKQQKIALLVQHIQTVCLNYNLKLWKHISNNNVKFDNLTQENVKIGQKIDDLSENLRSKPNPSASNENLLLLTVLLLIGVVVLIILSKVIIFLNLKTLNYQKLEIARNKIQPYETVINFTKPNDFVASSADTLKENYENYYQELPNDEISSTIVINNSENNVKIDETYSEVVEEPMESNEDAVLYAVVNKNAK